MNLIDLFIVLIVFISVTISFFRGLFSEIISLCSWLIAFWCAQQFAVELVKYLPLYLSPPAKMAIAFVIIFIAVRIIAVLLQSLINSLIKATGIGFINCSLGALFGFVRGLLLVTVLVLVAGFSKITKSSNWQASALIPPFEQVVLTMKVYLPKDMSQHLSYPEQQKSIDFLNIKNIFN